MKNRLHFAFFVLLIAACVTQGWMPLTNSPTVPQIKISPQTSDVNDAQSRQPAGIYTIDWYTIDGGGRQSQSEGFSLSGTIGQPDAGTLSSPAGYQLAGGFWRGGASLPPPNPGHVLYLPLIQR